ncbi:magnesium chelatase subunit D [Phreatobacter oligotrophus]|jgi:magnesium chelatase subunit D|uniref:magnesium chelatase subunit D n=1 Tax=Phreatobacter oligotrophus TaxID=1122261 RepID=UPI0023534DFE|nr:magnesium chelatase subunit D [Phreatobacter oligotrophus]MBX9991777.1 magnesium chelatase subunit D [Phreatobacter oligotrophus]
MSATSTGDDLRAAALAVAPALLAVDPKALGGVLLKGPAGPVRDRFIATLTAALPAGSPVLPVPCHVGPGRLIGEIDTTATLAAGRLIHDPGLFVRAGRGLLVLRSAERLEPSAAALVALALDEPGEGFGIVACDESLADEDGPARCLAERLALHLDLTGLDESAIPATDPAVVAAARDRLARVTIADAAVVRLAAAASALGVRSDRALLHCVRAARILAALARRATVSDADAETAAILVLAPRATRLPQAAADPAEAEDPPPPPPESEADNQSDPPPGDPAAAEDRVLDATVAALPPDLLAALAAGKPPARGRSPAGRSRDTGAASARGRQIGTRAGDPRRGRLDLLASVRSAVPWQRLRGAPPSGARLSLRPPDLRLKRLKNRKGATTIFCVDASGSTALERLAEAKGAVEQILADCYVRRDEVALVAFRGQEATLIVPPTRSLQRARACLQALPGGGGTPLAEGIAAACRLGVDTARRGRTPTLVLITDGRPNIGFGGIAGRDRAAEDATTAAREVAAHHLRALVIDSSARPEPRARALADTMGALYLALPHADSASLHRAVQAGSAALAAGVKP